MTDPKSCRSRRGLGFASAIALLVLSGAGCPGPARLNAGSRAASVVDVRDIRIRIASDEQRVRFRVAGPFSITGDQRRSLPPRAAGDWVEVTAATQIVLSGQATGARRIDVLPQRNAQVEFCAWSDGRWGPAARYIGKFVFLASYENKFDVLNVVDVDTYLVGVLARELYADFHREAYRAQAVAARTYALFEMARRSRDSYDVTSTEASQVYGGVASGAAGRKALEAVQYTKGIVCTWPSPNGQRIFCTYYSSACGGISQSVADAKHLPEIPPLSGNVRCNFCRIAKGEAYRWGPVTIAKPDLFASLVQRDPAIRELGGLDRVDVTARTETGRLGRIRLVGTNRNAKELYAEDFRLFAGSRTMRSTHCDLEDRGAAIVLFNGRGFGHGMGLCQWGMQGQALAGRSAAQILKYYYPGMHLTRAY